ncbi:MAG TPA: ATP-binding protein [Anaerolineae bacterium]|nr:ATP-binding protein [Anaerolineae bacterium]
MSDDNINTLEQNITSATTPIAKIDALNNLAWALTRTDEQRAIDLSQQAITLAQELDPPYPRGHAIAQHTLARIDSFRGQHGPALLEALEALTTLRQIGDKEAEARVLNTVGSCYRHLGNLSEALTYQFAQLELSEELGDDQSFARAHIGIGISYSDIGEPERTLEYFEKALAIFQKNDRLYWIVLTLNNISYVHVKLGQYTEAIERGLACLIMAREHQFPRMEAGVHTTLTEAYLLHKDLHNALKFAQAGLKLAQKHEYVLVEMECYKLIGQIHLEQNQPSAAIPSLLRAVEMSTATNEKRFQFESHQLVATAYKQIDDFENALIHHEKFHAIHNSVFNDQSDQKVKNLEVLHRTESANKEAKYYATLYANEQDRRQLAEVMQRVGQALTSSLDWQAVLNQVINQLHELVWFDRGALLLWQDDTLRFVAVKGYDMLDDPLTYTVDIDQNNEDNVFVRIYNSKKPLAINDISNYPAWRKVEDITNPETWLGIPLLHHNQVIGMLSLARYTKEAYTDEDITLANTFAAQAAIAIENAQLYSQIKQFNEQLEAKVQERTIALQEAYEQLERLDRTKSDFIAITAHELRTPITVLKGYGQILRLAPAIKGSPYESNLVEGINTGAGRLLDIVNTMLMMVKIDSRSLEIVAEPINIYDLVNTITADLAEDIKDRHQTVTIDTALQQLPPIEGDPAILGNVFSNLIRNAIKYTPDGGQITLHGHTWQTPPQPDYPAPAIQITVSDTGIGIKPDAIDLIFTKFYQTGEVAHHSSGQTKFKGGGPGLGLAIARGIIEAHGGLLWAESPGYDEATCPGSDFHVILPHHQSPPT